ncbi:hypothetical protein MRS44_017768 [Fusarium solani]|uniref:uncharacterized protein n=1 Tax=Fusarium solani TaxID=169388 RepID=UPI0032C3FCB8|nr:hypothetical protein MRS44_017768 [Fusarium solani]
MSYQPRRAMPSPLLLYESVVPASEGDAQSPPVPRRAMPSPLLLYESVVPASEGDAQSPPVPRRAMPSPLLLYVVPASEGDAQSPPVQPCCCPVVLPARLIGGCVGPRVIAALACASPAPASSTQACLGLDLVHTSRLPLNGSVTWGVPQFWAIRAYIVVRVLEVSQPNTYTTQLEPSFDNVSPMASTQDLELQLQQLQEQQQLILQQQEQLFCGSKGSFLSNTGSSVTSSFSSSQAPLQGPPRGGISNLWQVQRVPVPTTIHDTPHHPSGRPPLPMEAQVEESIKFEFASKRLREVGGWLTGGYHRNEVGTARSMLSPVAYDGPAWRDT